MWYDIVTFYLVNITFVVCISKCEIYITLLRRCLCGEKRTVCHRSTIDLCVGVHLFITKFIRTSLWRALDLYSWKRGSIWSLNSFMWPSGGVPFGNKSPPSKRASLHTIDLALVLCFDHLAQHGTLFLEGGTTLSFSRSEMREWWNIPALLTEGKFKQSTIVGYIAMKIRGEAQRQGHVPFSFSLCVYFNI